MESDPAIPGLAELRRGLLDAAPATDNAASSRQTVVVATRADRAAVNPIVLAILAVVAVEIIGFAIYDLLGIGGGDTHASRHLGSFNLAYAVAVLSVVHRPVRARAILPVAIVLGAALAVTAVVDVVSGNIPLVGEATHLAELISIPLIWAIASGRARTAHRQP